ncbi:hypothetical protein C7212DRAFT_347627 [Tuber magnatum]|uniref:AAA+ ATPase domain-containing protein n=1 Tax=Tuber magnatum TaxID=42249 RepID=A0A317SFA4_9PEZI|nr:hypothetical protein C7212DRAFT_347627 [Tuber magnatum]
MSIIQKPKGSCPNILEPEILVERKGITKEIISLLQPAPSRSTCSMIVGNPGVGKTTLVHHIGHQLAGVVYMDIGPESITDEALGEEFARALWWPPRTSTWLDALQRMLFPTNERRRRDNRRLFNEVLAEFSNLAKIFMRNNGRPPVLVIDHVNRLYSKDLKLLELLQDIAKGAADERLFFTVFVTTEGEVPNLMRDRTHWSGIGRVLGVGYLSHSEAINFLCNKHGKSPEVAEDIYELVGGRAILLLRVIHQLSNGVPFPGMFSALYLRYCHASIGQPVLVEVRAPLLKEAKKKFQKAEMVDEGKFRGACVQIAQQILKNDHIQDEDFFDIALINGPDGWLLTSNIFAATPDSGGITFESKLTENLAREFVKEVAMAAPTKRK